MAEAGKLLIQSCVRIGKVAIQRLFEISQGFVFAQSVGRDVKFDAAGDEYAILFIDGVVKFCGHGF